MEGERFDALTTRLTALRSRRLTLKAVAGGLLALGLGWDDAAAACNKDGQSCKKDKNCCSKNCTGKKGKKTCRCRKVQSACSDQDQCCTGGSTGCFTNHCSDGDKQCCRFNDSPCQESCDCCGDNRCVLGKCCVPQGGLCAFGAVCCPHLGCDVNSGVTCQPLP